MKITNENTIYLLVGLVLGGLLVFLIQNTNQTNNQALAIDCADRAERRQKELKEDTTIHYFPPSYYYNPDKKACYAEYEFEGDGIYYRYIVNLYTNTPVATSGSEYDEDYFKLRHELLGLDNIP